MPEPVTGFVLAGGKSSRMGMDKALLDLNGATLLSRTRELLESVCRKVFVLGPKQRYGGLGECVEDIHPDCGPLGGIHAALLKSRTRLNLIVAVDTPFLSKEFLDYLVDRAAAGDAVVTVPEIAGHVQPLCAVYSREFLPIAENALKKGEYKIVPLFPAGRIVTVTVQELAQFGVGPEMFDNLNTPEDLDRARRRALRPSAMSNHHAPSHNAHDGHHERPGEHPLPYIEFRHVSKSFNDHKVLDDVSFSIRPGQTLCILGRSGVGKSVSLHHIMGFLKPDVGRIIVAFEDITDYTEEELERIRKKVTMVFQNGALFDSLTVGENVAFPLRERHDLDEAQIYQIVDGLLDMVGVKAMRDLLPSDLSTGMKRSVAIARSLAAQPECILYDEPTTMVDPLMASLLGDLIQKLKLQLKLTSIVVTHDMRLATKLADCIVFLHEGKAIFFGTVKEMEKDPHPVIQEFLELDRLIVPGMEQQESYPQREDRV